MSFQSPSLIRLTLFGLVFVTLPLIYAVFSAIDNVEQLATESRDALESVQENTTLTRALEARAIALERSARQYHAVREDDFLEIYANNQAEIAALLQTLSQGAEDPELLTALAPLAAQEAAVHALLLGSDTSDAQLDAGLLAFRDQVTALIRAQNDVAARLAESVPARVLRVKRKLIDQAAYAIPLSAIFAAVLVWLIRRPLQQLKSSIRNLGHGALGEPVRVQGSRDLVELGQRLEWLRQRLRELESQKSQFLRNVSHELKTPLSSIREGAALLAEENGSESPEERQQILAIVLESSLQLQRMIEELLRYGAEGDLSLQVPDREVDLRALTQSLLLSCEPSLALRNITLEQDLSPITLKGNEPRMRVIMNNLLSNAIRHTPVGGKISVTLKARGSRAEFAVKDSGPGIPESFRPALFEWFKTGPQAPDTPIAGSGLGLAIAQEYARQQGGTIELLESESDSDSESESGAHFAWRTNYEPTEAI